jgi:tetratricopeptide (TPR) repeat protein
VHKLEQALIDLNQAVAIRQKLLAAKRLFDENDLATALMNRGLAYAERYQFPKALADFNQVVAIRQKLLVARRLRDENDLAEAFMNRGKTYSYMHRVKKAVDDLHKALHIIRSLLPERAFLIERYIEYVYSLLNVKKENKRTGALDEVVHELHETLKQYELTEEAREWLDQINELLSR